MTTLQLDQALARFASIPDEAIVAALTNDPRPEDLGGWRQSREGEENYGIAAGPQIRALVANHTFWEFCAEVFPNNDVIDTGRPGAPQRYPDWLLFLVQCGAGMRQHTTISKSVDYFKDRAAWNEFAAFVDPYVPADMTRLRDLPYRKPRSPRRTLAKPGTPKHSRTKARKPELRLVRPSHLEPQVPGPQGHHVDMFRLRWRGTEKVTKRPFLVGHRDFGMRDKAMAAFRRLAVDQAQAMGMLDPNVPLAFKKPDRNQFVGADGVVFPVPRKGNNPTAAVHETGVGKVYGSKYTMFSIRISGQYMSRVILDFVHTLKAHEILGDDRAREAHLATDESQAVLDVMPHLAAQAGSGLHGLLVDSAVRGQALVQLQRSDMVVVNYPYAESNPNSKEGGRLAKGRVEKNHLRHIATHAVPDFSGKPRVCQHPIFAVGGELLEVFVDEGGKDAVRPLKIEAFQRRGKAPEARQYLIARITCHHGDAFDERIPLFHDGKTPGSLRGVNWGEFCRVFAPGTKQFKYLYGARNDTEARHSDLKARMTYLPRDIAGQELRLLGAAMAVNAIAWQVHLQAHHEANVIDNTA